MTDYGIIFSGPMVKALLREIDRPGTGKTQTRRLAWKGDGRCPACGYSRADMTLHADHQLCKGPGPMPTTWQRVKPGDRLWVRETWAEVDGPPRSAVYKADLDNAHEWCWTPSIHMPRWASRITLHVTAVKREPVQAISEEDAIAEGIYKTEPTAEDLEWYRDFAQEHFIDIEKDPMEGVWLAPGTRQGWGASKNERDQPQWGPTPEFCFRLVWTSPHGPGAWDENPEVVAMTFRPTLANIGEAT